MQSLSIDLNIWAVKKYKFYNRYLNNISTFSTFDYGDSLISNLEDDLICREHLFILP